MTNFWDDLMGDDEHAATYMETYGEGPGFELRHKLGSLIKPNESILDVGCGPGWNYDHFKEYGPEVRYKGLDYSERFVRVALLRVANKFGLVSTAPLPFEHGDVRDIKEADDSWDVVIVQDCLEHTNGYEKPTYEVLRVAKRLVIITFWHLEDSDSPHINDDGKDGWGAWYDKREWEAFLDTLGKEWKHERLVIGKNRDVYEIYI